MHKYKELITKSKADLLSDLSTLKKEQMNLRFQKAYGQLEKSHQIRVVRRAIAKCNTALSYVVQRDTKNA